LGDHGWIDTLEGSHIVCPGDWIITGVQGEHYPCKPDIFEATYDPAVVVCIDCNKEIDTEEIVSLDYEKCEGGCGPVCEHCVQHDVEGVPLCEKCMQGLIDDAPDTQEA
jgi:hypothetical protein